MGKKVQWCWPQVKGKYAKKDGTNFELFVPGGQ
jgi:hypothetical protein